MPDYCLNKLKAVLAEYGLYNPKITLETWKDKKAVWWVNDGSKKYILKKLPVSKTRLVFVLAAINHLRRNGINIPEICPTSKGTQFFEDNEDLYIMMEAVTGKAPGYTEPRELAAIIEGLAAFHLASKKFTPPPGAGVREHLASWEKKYSQSLADLQKYREQAKVNSEGDFERIYLQYCDYFIRECKNCIELLKKPDYAQWVNKVRQETNLCHQDFAAGNLGLVDGKLYVFDLDSITVDLPARDIRKILNKVMKKRGQWDFALTNRILGYYHKVNPLSAAEYRVVFTDIRFPHLFYGIASKYFENRETEWSRAKYLNKFQVIAKVEKSKEDVIKKQEEIIEFLTLGVSGLADKRTPAQYSI